MANQKQIDHAKKEQKRYTQFKKERRERDIERNKKRANKMLWNVV